MKTTENEATTTLEAQSAPNTETQEPKAPTRPRVRNRRAVLRPPSPSRPRRPRRRKQPNRPPKRPRKPRSRRLRAPARAAKRMRLPTPSRRCPRTLCRGSATCGSVGLTALYAQTPQAQTPWRDYSASASLP